MEIANVSAIPQQLEIANSTPISDLSPEISEPALRAVRGIVTITWPYNSVKGSFAFILAEPDFRLRRNRGQVRINFTGSAAKALGECGLGGNDEIYLSLDGAEWEPEETRKRQSLPGAGIDWQLKFSNKLLLQAKLGEARESKVISIDHSTLTEPAQAIDEQPVVTPNLRDSPPPLPPAEFTAFTPAKDIRIAKLNDEYTSPAFIKRARLSYGSLFEDGFDIFEDDGAVKGKGRKRTRFGRESGAWRYSSQSPSPEPSPEPPAASRAESGGDEHVVHMSSPLRPGMADEGCQTMELDIYAPAPAPPSTITTPREPQESLPVAETQPHPGDGLVDQSVQAVPQKESPPGSLVAIQRLPPIGTSQHVPTDIPPFFINHEPSTVSDIFQPRWETKTIGNATHVYGEDQPVHEQTPGDLLPTGPDDGLADHQPPSMDDIGQTNLSYPPIDRTSFDMDGENNHDTSHNDQQDNPLYDTPHMPYPPLDIADSEEVQPSAPDMLNNYPPSYLEDSHNISQQPMEAQPRAFIEELHSSLGPVAVEVGPTWTTVNHPSEATPMPQAHRLGSADGQSPETPMVIYEDESDDEPAPAPTAVEDTLVNGHADALEMYEDAEAEDEADAMYSDEDEPEHEADEIGGDYDARNYVEPDDDEDDSHDEDLRLHELEPQFDDAEEWDEEDGLEDEEEERRYQTDSENDYDMDEEEEGWEEEDEEEGEAIRPAPRVSQSTPTVIDLVSSSEDEDDGEEEDKGVQLPQPLPATSGGLVYMEDPPSRARQSSDDEFESQEEEDMSEHLSVTSNIREAIDKDEIDEEEQTERVERTGSADDEHREEAPPEDDFSNASEEARMEDKARKDVEPIAMDEHVLPISNALEPEEILEEKEVVVDQEQQEQDIGPFTAAEGLEMLSQTINQEEAKAEAGGEVDVVQINSERTATLTTEDGDEAPQSRDVEMIESNVIEDSEAIAQDEVRKTGAEDIEMAETDAIADEKESPATNEDLEPVDLIKSSPENSLKDRSIENEFLQDFVPAPSSPPLTHSFSSQATELKAEVPIHESRMPSGSQLPADQLLTPLDTQLTEPTESQEMPAVSISISMEETHDITQTTTISEAVVEQDQVHTVEVVTTQIEGGAISQIETQHQSLVGGEHTEEAPQVSQPVEPIPIMVSKTQVDIDDMIQASLRGETPIAAVEPDITVDALDADSSGVSSSFRSQMESDEELQASILEENSFQLDEERKESPEADAPSPPGSDGDSHYQDDDNIIPEPETHENIGGASSPVLGNDNATKPEETQSDSAETLHTKEHLQLPAESDQESLNEEYQPDPSVELARAANATRRRGKTQHFFSEASRPLKSSEDGYSIRSEEEAEDSSVQLARASMSTLSKAEEESSSLVEAKLQLARHLRDELPDCTQLQTLRHHIGHTLDVMAVAMMQPPDPQRAKGGPREYMMSFTITDQSTAPNRVVEVQLYRPHKDALPIVKPGDVVLLRKFKVVALQGKGFGLRTVDGSSWAVWDSCAADDGQPQVRGPPVEAIEKETRHAAYLREWLGLLDEQARDKLESANQKIIGANKNKASAPKA